MWSHSFESLIQNLMYAILPHFEPTILHVSTKIDSTGQFWPQHHDVVNICGLSQVVISQMNGQDYSSHSVHVLIVGRMRIKLSRGWITKAREIYSPTMQVNTSPI